jgi:hypothetical protein
MKRGGRIVLVLLLVLFASGFASRLGAQDRLELGAQLAVHRLPELGETPVGYGFRLTYNAYLPLVAFDSEVNFFPTSSTGNLGETQGFFGLRAGVHVSRWGIYAKLRPGFASFGGGGFEQRLTARTHFALDVGGVLKYDVAPHVALRWDLSEVLTYFGNATLLAGPGPVGVPLGTRHNFETTIGAVLQF